MNDFFHGLLVIGVGRSGTSIATQLGSTLGLRPPNEADLMPGNYANPTGYWESTSLAAFNDELLARWGSTWWTPPPVVISARIEELSGGELWRAQHLFRMAFGCDPGWIWKDPRLTVLLPFWERAIGINPILVPSRDPLAVAHSIAVRDGLQVEQSLAIWECHTRLLLRALHGRRALITNYDGLRSNPQSWRETLRLFCMEAGLAVTPPTEPAEPMLIQSKNARASCALNPWQQSLADFVRGLEGSHSEFPDVTLPDPSPDLDQILSGIKQPSWLPPHEANKG